MEMPSFLSLEGRSLVFNKDNATFVFYVPANYFNNTSKAISSDFFSNSGKGDKRKKYVKLNMPSMKSFK